MYQRGKINVSWVWVKKKKKIAVGRFLSAIFSLFFYFVHNVFLIARAEGLCQITEL